MHSSTANPSQLSPASSSPSLLSDPQWASVSEQRQNELLEKHRNVNVTFDWWGSVYEQFVEKLAEIGIEVEARPRQGRAGRVIYEPEIFFTGFYSQGDGACFNGHVSDWAKLLTAMGEEKFIGDVDHWVFKCRSDGRYRHSNTMCFDGELLLSENPFDPEGQLLQHEAWALTHTSEKERGELRDRLEAKFKALADELYADLETEYEHLTSDESVVEFILEHTVDELVEDHEQEAA